MTPQDQWYYLEGSETRGPVSAAQIVQMIRAGTLASSTQVAQAGWRQWSQASVALANLISPAAQDPQTPAPETPIYAIKVHCICGPILEHVQHHRHQKRTHKCRIEQHLHAKRIGALQPPQRARRDRRPHHMPEWRQPRAQRDHVKRFRAQGFARP